MTTTTATHSPDEPTASPAPGRQAPRAPDLSRVAVMGIVNRTPDSFYDRGRTFALEAAVEAALRAVAEGADWVDVGGVPFSPDTPAVGIAEELDRVVPVVAAIRAVSDVVISVDTTQAQVAAASIEAGADVVNDTNGLRDDAMLDVVARTGATVVVAHSLAAPHVHLPRPQYGDVVAEVAAFLRERVAHAVAHGVARERIVVDPGHDLNKNTSHSLELTRRLDEITAIGPTLVALSRKDFVGETLGRPADERLAGSLAVAAWCVEHGARVVRAHDVRATVDAVRMIEAVLGRREPVEHRHNR
ncbi:dihydropteroate synthase [Cellulomonas sp. SG140]|uniref:dihydropteroate synthase n=1 Tax=Cellulomonas sp. SG140 TaxID=2976536 RepID=UPI003991292C